MTKELLEKAGLIGTYVGQYIAIWRQSNVDAHEKALLSRLQLFAYEAILNGLSMFSLTSLSAGCLKILSMYFINQEW